MNFYQKSLILLVLLALSTQCSATSKKRSFGEVVDDSVVSMKLHTKFTKDKVVKDRQIRMKVWKGVVTLTGQVDSQDQINRAIEMAEQQAGVDQVKTYLVLKTASPKRKKGKLKRMFSSKSKMDVQEVDLGKDTSSENSNPKEVEVVKEVQVVKSNHDGASVSQKKSQDYQELEF